jgi:hypothetical protein
MVEKETAYVIYDTNFEADTNFSLDPMKTVIE